MTTVPPSQSASAAPLLTGGLPPINPAFEPASVRNGSPAAKQAYQVGLSFEEMLVGQLAQELTTTVAGSSNGDPASSALAGLIPDALTSSIMSGGGLGIAREIAASIDPSIKARK